MDLFADKRHQPKLELESTSLQRALLVLAWMAVALNAGVIAYYWPQLPASVPQHFDASGEVDGWGPRALLALLPVLSLVLVGGITWLMRYPHLYNYLWPITEENAPRQYQLANQMLAAIEAVTAFMFAIMSWEICRIAVGETGSMMPYFLPVMMILLFGSIGVYLVYAHRAR